MPLATCSVEQFAAYAFQASQNACVLEHGQLMPAGPVARVKGDPRTAWVKDDPRTARACLGR